MIHQLYVSFCHFLPNEPVQGKMMKVILSALMGFFLVIIFFVLGFNIERLCSHLELYCSVL